MSNPFDTVRRRRIEHKLANQHTCGKRGCNKKLNKATAALVEIYLGTETTIVGNENRDSHQARLTVCSSCVDPIIEKMRTDFHAHKKQPTSSLAGQDMIFDVFTWNGSETVKA